MSTLHVYAVGLKSGEPQSSQSYKQMVVLTQRSPQCVRYTGGSPHVTEQQTSRFMDHIKYGEPLKRNSLPLKGRVD